MFNKIKEWFYLEIYLSSYSAVRWRYEALRRSIREAIRAWSCYDFDFAYLYEVQLNKALDLQKCLLNDPYHDLSDADLPQLQELINILKRLKDENYDEVYLDVLYAKWGEPDWNVSRQFIDDEQRERYFEELRTCYELAEKDRNRDIDRMCDLLKTSSRKWWC